MIRDLESLMEYLYLRSINSDLLIDDIIVNPKESDNIRKKTVIINNISDSLRSDLSPDRIITRVPYKDAKVTPYQYWKSNEYIGLLNIDTDKVSVIKSEDDIYYFTKPLFQYQEGSCYDYLSKCLGVSGGTRRPKTLNLCYKLLEDEPYY